MGAYQRPEWNRTWLMERIDIETGSKSANGVGGPDESHPFGVPEPKGDDIMLTL
jgi:hypothetical protein